jgi:hypothetical protein
MMGGSKRLKKNGALNFTKFAMSEPGMSLMMMPVRIPYKSKEKKRVHVNIHRYFEG